MKFYFDESGDFSIPADPMEHAVAVVAGIAITETVEKVLSAKFSQFVAGLNNSELVDDEPKGSLLTIEHKRDFCDLLAGFKGRISLTPVTLDLSTLSGSAREEMNKDLAKLLQEQAERMTYDEMKQQMMQLSKQAGNLSLEQDLRIYSTINCFREEKVFSFMVLAWLAGWSRSHPLETLKGLHTKDHPFIRRYDTPEGIRIDKIVRDNLYWEDSKDSWGLQVADIAANIVYQAASRLDNDKEALAIYGSLMRCSAYGSGRGPGLFTPLVDEVPDNAGEKYIPLSEAMDKRWDQ